MLVEQAKDDDFLTKEEVVMRNTLRSLIVAACALSLVGGAIGVTGCSSSKYHRSAGRTVDDASLTAKVKTDILKDPVMSGSSINVDTYNGQVQLNGWVNTPEQKQEAANIARSVSGVLAVQNNLALKEAAGAGQ